MKSTHVSQSIAAATQLRLPGATGRVARKMRYMDEVAPRFRGGYHHPSKFTATEKTTE
jgi:hypothetical protein